MGELPMDYDCECEFEHGSIECVVCLLEFVKDYNQDNPDDKLELYGALAHEEYEELYGNEVSNKV